MPYVCTTTSATFHGSDLYDPGYPGGDPSYLEYQFHPNVVSVISATSNGNPIVEGVDYYIRGGYDSNPDWPNEHDIFVPLRAFAAGDTIVINYYTGIPGGASGTYTFAGAHGGNWRDTFVTYGTHYPISISSTSASLNKNPEFFLKSTQPGQGPLLGEIDWRWYTTGSTHPLPGYYKIDILDVVKCTSSYSMRGDGTYNSAYFPGADLDSNDLCHVGITDLVSITGKYAAQWGNTPP